MGKPPSKEMVDLEVSMEYHSIPDLATESFNVDFLKRIVDVRAVFPLGLIFAQVVAVQIALESVARAGTAEHVRLDLGKIMKDGNRGTKTRLLNAAIIAKGLNFGSCDDENWLSAKQ